MGGTGADIASGEIFDVVNYGAAGGFRGYSVGVTPCNIGTDPIDWIFSTPEHPVLVQNLYRLYQGRFEQIGNSWIKHEFFALQSDACNCNCIPLAGSQLGVGCSSPSGAALNGNQPGLGPHGDLLDPAAGIHTGAPSLNPPIVDVTSRRLRVAVTDLDPALQPGAQYFVEAHYLAPDDALAGNAFNNASYREVLVTGPNLDLTFTGTTQIQSSAIQAWQDLDPAVALVDVPTPDGGLMVVGYTVSDNGNGTWDYEYAVYNMNSTRGASAFSIPNSAGVSVTNLGFHDIEYHSGEPIDNLDWNSQVTSNSIRWSLDANSNNALRWGSLYNFRFTANAAPVLGDATLILFEPGVPDNVGVQLLAPGIGGGSDFVRGDCSGDGSTNIADAVFLLGSLFPGPAGPNVIECDDACDANDDSGVNLADAVAILSSLFGMPPLGLPAPVSCGADPTVDSIDCMAFGACP